ncbi:MAG: hypothetical protein J0L73_28225 [Verrucomicrobia bacterium]|nr:hypothetical protein [Verrucomicrobiota bacterium]
MKYHHRILALLLIAPLLLLLTPAQAADAPGGVRAFKDMLKDIPAKEMLKLWSDKKAEVALSITRQIETKEVGKVGTYRGKVTKIDPYSFRNENLVGWRLGVEESFKRGGDTLLVFSWVMVHTDPDGLIPKIRLGDEITVTGTVNRAELTAIDNPRLNVDLIVPVMNNGKGAAEKATAEKPMARPAAPAVMPTPTPAPAAAPVTAAVKAADYPLDRILDALPEASRATLSTAPLATESIPALNAALSTLALRKPFKLTFKIEAAAALPKSPERFQIRAAPGLLSGKYPAIQQQWVHLYMPTASATEIARAGLGATVTMSGTITRIDIITTPQGVRQLQLNLEDAQVLTPP